MISEIRCGRMRQRSQECKEGASPCQLCDSNIPYTNVSASIMQRRQRSYLEVSLDITEERDVAYSRGDEEEKGTGKDEDGKEGRDCESGRNHIVPREIFLEVVPRRLVILL